jgi:phospholipid N-methyltransferase
MPEDSVLLVFEINKEFCDKLSEINDSRIKVISDSAEHLVEYLAQNKIEKVDYIVSSLPFAMIPNSIVKNILSVAKKVLGTTGTYIQYQYSLNALRKLKDTFKDVDLNFTPMNIPPAFVFVCKN